MSSGEEAVPVAHTNDYLDQDTEPLHFSKAPSKKGKKKKKVQRSHGAGLFATGEEEHVLAEQTIATVSPPAHGGLEHVDVDASDFPPDPMALAQDEPPSPPPLLDLDEDVTPVRGVSGSLGSPAHSLPMNSPRSAASHLEAPVRSPPSTERQSRAFFHAYDSPGGFQPPTANAKRTAPRKESIPAYASSPPDFVEPHAPPHMAQPHFYGSPELRLDFDFKKRSNDPKAAGSNGYCCCFDSLSDSGDAASAKKAKDALLVGSEGGLEVFRLLPNKVEVVGRLEGLRGSVIGAKILPHVRVYDNLQKLRPLVAVIIHGPVDEASSPIHYQTTVEIYSLQTQEHIALLYQTPPVAVEQPTIGHLTSLPEPTEDFTMSAQADFIVLASGKSGEVFLFTNTASSIEAEGQFRCIGKFWTSLQTSLTRGSSRPSSSSETNQTVDAEVKQQRLPLLSLSHRWLALVPPPSASNVSIQGTPLLLPHNTSPPGVASAVAPPQPPVTCELAGIDAEDAWSRLTRQAAQGVVKYSQKGIDLGWQGWKELTNPTPPSHQLSSSNEREGLFPPTKAPPDEPQTRDKEPAIVTLIDLEALLEAEEAKAKHPPSPLASFALPDGCNFLSFSANGLRLITASRKGETSYIWDLSDSCHGKHRHDSGSSHGSTKGPTVTLIHRIPRSSPSVVLDCAWSQDDEFLAMLTMNGTIHLHEIPTRVYSPRRRRRSTITSPRPDKAQPTVSVSQGASPPSSGGGFLGSIKSGWQQVSTNIRGSTSSASFGIPTFAGFRDATTSVGHAGGRVIAKGFSQGFSAAKGGASDYWHSEDNKIRNKGWQNIRPASLKWVKRHSDLFLAVVCGGTVHLHPVQRVQRRKGDVTISGLKQDRRAKKDFALPAIRTRASLEAANGAIPARTAADTGPHGFWSLRNIPATSNTADRRTSAQLPPTQANEVETNPPYCPFHIDSRVDIYAYDDAEEDNLRQKPSFFTLGHGHRLSKKTPEPPWLFGDPLPFSTKLNTHDNLDYFHRDEMSADYNSDLEMDLSEAMKSVLTIHPAEQGDGMEEIRIHTRPAARDGFGGEDESGGGLEDDDDVF